MIGKLINNDNKTLIVLSVVFILLMFLNYYLIFISDTVVNYNRVFYEEGVVESNSTIPRDLSNEEILLGRGLNRKTYFIIEGFNSSCKLLSFKTNNTYEILLNNTIYDYKLELNYTDIFFVLKTTGNLTYRYEVYSVEKPLLFLGVIAFLISILGLGFGLYIFVQIVLRRVSKTN